MMHHHLCSSIQTGGPPGPTVSINEVMGCSSSDYKISLLLFLLLFLLLLLLSSPPPPLQPFDIFYFPTAFNFQEMMAGSTLGLPFTAAQWKELETQAMIYKYMVASVPVPYELLLPIIQNLPPSISPLGRQLRYSTKQDLEPGRCKRTDGKKWRCSRDVAPNQKYCERHLHRGRPRSRKHVELSKNPTNNKTPPSQSSTLSSNSNPCKVVGSTILPSSTETPFSLANMHSKRGVDWSMEGGSEQQWGQIMKTSSSIFNTEFVEEQPLLDLSSFTTTDFGTPTRRDFIDAWSTDKNSVAKDAALCVSVCSTGNLDLSMGMGMGLLSPLAEVLGPNSSSVANPTSPSSYPTGGGGGGDSLSPPPTTVSSPSGVLHRTMLSLSDGSVCNSPTLASTPTDTVAFQWFT